MYHSTNEKCAKVQKIFAIEGKPLDGAALNFVGYLIKNTVLQGVEMQTVNGTHAVLAGEESPAGRVVTFQDEVTRQKWLTSIAKYSRLQQWLRCMPGPAESCHQQESDRTKVQFP
jgi:hypothetical protein